MLTTDGRLAEPPSILTDPTTHLPLYRTVDGAWMSLDGSRFIGPEDAADFETEARAYMADPFAGMPPETWPEWTAEPVE